MYFCPNKIFTFGRGGVKIYFLSSTPDINVHQKESENCEN